MTEPLSPRYREQLETLFDRAADLPPAEHAAFVARERKGNDPLRPGTMIGAYKLLEVIGQGGMGQVYAAEQREPREGPADPEFPAAEADRYGDQRGTAARHGWSFPDPPARRRPRLDLPQGTREEPRTALPNESNSLLGGADRALTATL